ncbi:MAG: hypothetical protein KAT05_04520 [Spirochaetes bacterium]|nr:hypothetical protein [Spirochaetota bacterium]
MSVNKKLPIIFVIALIAVTAGCLDYGDIGTVINSWNKITDKGEQFNTEIESLNYETLDYDDSIQTQRELQKINTKINKIQQILDEENALISDFAGTTVKVTGDANKYANEALTYIRESHKYKVKAFSSLQDMNAIVSDVVYIVAAMDENNIDEMEDSLNKIKAFEKNIESIESEGNINAERADESYNKAYDAIKKLEALQ